MSQPGAAEPIRVMLVDDHTLFRKGLAELLEQRGTIKVAAIAGNGDDALRQLDASGAARLLIETPPAGPAWEAVHDRLSRAAATFAPASP